MLTVKERGHFVATLRYVHVSLMETLAAWVPTTPEMEVKLLFGEHIWDVAQHADSLGKRTFELRMPLQKSMRAADGYVDFLAAVASDRADAPAPGGHVRRAAARPRRAPAALCRADGQAGRCADGAHPGAFPGRRRPHDRRCATRCATSCRRCSWLTGNGLPTCSTREAALDLLAAAPAESRRGGGLDARRRRSPRSCAASRCAMIRPASRASRSCTCTTTCRIPARSAEEARRQRAHRDYNQEVQTLEIAALCLVDFPDAPWELRMEFARQCWDEARHAELDVPPPEGAGWLEGHVSDRQPGLVGGGDARLAAGAARGAAPHVRGRVARHREAPRFRCCGSRAMTRRPR